ncbi:MAG: xanthine dehydrogenase accessory protein XdhC, partial [Mesorhizobium sp.]
VKDKRPQVIAALAAAEIMTALAAHAGARAAPHPVSRGKAMAG